MTSAYWPLTAGLFIAVNLTLLVYGWRFRHRPGGRAFLVFLLCAAIWTVGQTIFLSAPSLTLKTAGVALRAFAAVSLPASIFVFVLIHTGRAQWVTSRLLTTLAGWPLLTIVLVAVNPGEFAGSNVRLGAGTSTTELLFTPGPFDHLSTVYAYALLALTTALIIVSMFRPPTLSGRQAAPLLIATIVPWLSNVLLVGGISPTPALDLTTPAVTIAALALLWTLFHDYLLDLAPIARAAIFSSMSDGVVVLDTSRRIVDLNPAAERILGRTAADMLGLPATGVLAASILDGTGPEGQRVTRHDLAIGQGADQREYELRYSPLVASRDRHVGWLIVLRDVTDRKALERQLRHQAFHDPLTGLVNRRLFLERLGQALAIEQPDRVALLFIDLDGFKKVNDLYGHAAGDDLLKAVGKRLLGCTRAEDVVSRFGGDEFALLLAPVSGESEVQRVVDRVLLALGDPFGIGGETIRIGGSIGYVFAAPGARPDSLLQQADLALYAAKAAGKGRAVAFHPSLETETALSAESA